MENVCGHVCAPAPVTRPEKMWTYMSTYMSTHMPVHMSAHIPYTFLYRHPLKCLHPSTATRGTLKSTCLCMCLYTYLHTRACMCAHRAPARPGAAVVSVHMSTEKSLRISPHVCMHMPADIHVSTCIDALTCGRCSSLTKGGDRLAASPSTA